jgi:exodeoxyribonuclease V alpha subunit
LAEAVNHGAWQAPAADSEVRIHTLERDAHAGDRPPWLAAALAHYRTLAEAIVDEADIARLLERLGDFQLLCALREGRAGVAGINRRLERSLGADYRRRTGRDPERAGRPWFPGLPVLVLRNDHERRLYNGDVGLVLPVAPVGDGGWRLAANHEHPDDHQPAGLRACFRAATDTQGGAVKAISLAQMPPFESAFALTVHKSQGSEYRRVSFVLPDDPDYVRGNPVLTRELLYTGITRAKQTLDLWAGAGVPEAIARRRTVRMSGLCG